MALAVVHMLNDLHSDQGQVPAAHSDLVRIQRVHLEVRFFLEDLHRDVGATVSNA